MLEQGADIDVRDHFKRTPLINAVNKGYEEIVKILLEYGADVNIMAEANKTAFDYAIPRKSILDLLKSDYQCVAMENRRLMKEIVVVEPAEQLNF